MPSITRTMTTTVTITAPEDDSFMQSKHVRIEYVYPDGLVSAVFSTDTVMAVHALTNTKPDPHRMREVEEDLMPGSEGTAMHLYTSLVNFARQALADKFAYPVRDSVWHRRPPLQMESFRDSIHKMLLSMGDANARLARDVGSDFTEQLRGLGEHYAIACNRPPYKEAEIAVLGYTACEIVLLGVFCLCAQMGAAFTAHGISGGQDMVDAAEDARYILQSAVSERTRHNTMQ